MNDLSRRWPVSGHCGRPPKSAFGRLLVWPFATRGEPHKDPVSGVTVRTSDNRSEASTSGGGKEAVPTAVSKSLHFKYLMILQYLSKLVVIYETDESFTVLLKVSRNFHKTFTLKF